MNRTKLIDPASPIIKSRYCTLCNREFKEEDVQYISVFVENHSHCEDCENATREGTGSAKLAHPYLLYKVTPHSAHLNLCFHGS